jgi:hypothetical protein
MADEIERTFKPEPEQSEKLGSITPEEFEESVQHKSGRVRDLAARFGVPEAAITALLSKPDAKVHVAERGWLKVRQ